MSADAAARTRMAAPVPLESRCSADVPQWSAPPTTTA